MSKRFQIEWANVAKGDLAATLSYIDAHSPGSSADSLEFIFSKVALLEEFPLQGRIVPELLQHGDPRFRELIIRRWRLVYHVEGQQVSIVSFIDSRQNAEDILLQRFLR